jgi:hypothetical protein
VLQLLILVLLLLLTHWLSSLSVLSLSLASPASLLARSLSPNVSVNRRRAVCWWSSGAPNRLVLMHQWDSWI